MTEIADMLYRNYSTMTVHCFSDTGPDKNVIQKNKKNKRSVS